MNRLPVGLAIDQAISDAEYGLMVAMGKDSERPGEAFMRLHALNLHMRAMRTSLTLAEAVVNPGSPVTDLVGGDRIALAHVAMLGSVQSLMATLDTCADIVAILGGRAVSLTARTTSMEELLSDFGRAGRPSVDPPVSLKMWTISLGLDGRWSSILAWRHSLVHRSYNSSRDFDGIDGETPDLFDWTVRLCCGPEHQHQSFYFPADLKIIVEFGDEAVLSFCAALLKAFPIPVAEAG